MLKQSGFLTVNLVFWKEGTRACLLLQMCLTSSNNYQEPIYKANYKVTATKNGSPHVAFHTM